MPFKMKKKPSAPRRTKTPKYQSVYFTTLTVAQLKYLLEEVPGNATIKSDHTYDPYGGNCYGADCIQLWWSVPEPIEKFKAREQAYLKRLAEYEKWEAEHKEEIKEFKASKQKQKAETKKAQLEQIQKRLTRDQKIAKKLQLEIEGITSVQIPS
jgi:hypothetical protein